MTEKNSSNRTLEDDLQALREKGKNTALSVSEILSVLSGRGKMIILILLSLPFCQPIQIPGFSTPFGLAISFLGLRIAFGKHLWLPKSVLSKKISSKTLMKITNGALLVSKKMKPWIHSRLLWVNHSHTMQVVHGLMIFFLGLLLALPLPIPFSNLLAAWSIFLISMGLLEDDGVLVLCGYVVAFFALLLFIFIAFSVKSFFTSVFS